jgi:non-specific serine/threonine protein kinase/serine/threonine-protein kinase
VTPERWKQVEAVFEQALERPAGERTAFLQQTCNGDEELRREVESLLDSHERAGSFIDQRSMFLSQEILEQETPSVQTGQLIGPYRVVREIGRGGMGAVYLAERADEQYQKRVAIKLIKRGMDTDSVLRHFRNERQILASFDHPNIARLFDGGTTTDGLPYFVMEYVDGVPIDKYADAHGLTINDRLKVFLQVCAAVSYAHRHTVIHRDVKPSNIFVTNDGVPKLLDFGVAKILQSGDGVESLMTMPGARPMTPEYASPEQVRGEPVTTASDVYSLGVVLYELLTGSSPYRLSTRAPREIERAITEQEPTKPSTVARNSRIVNGESDEPRMPVRLGPNYDSRKLRGDLDNIVLMALRKEPARRYQSVEQFAGDIRRHLESRPVLARRDTVSYRAKKFVQRNKVATAAAILVLISLVVGLIATSWETHRARVEKARAERRFNDVRRLAHSVLFDYHDAIKDLPGATRARERLVKDALTYLDSLAGEAAGDPGLQRELASAYERVGDVRGEAFSASLGDMAGAMESYEKALRIRETMVAADPHDTGKRRELAATYTKIGKQLEDTKEAALGLEHLRKAFALYQQLAVEQPADRDIRDRLAATHNDLGMTLENLGDIAGELERHREALRLRQELLAADPKNEEYRRNLSVSYVNMGRALVLSGNTNAALEANRKGMELCAALLAEHPTNATHRHRLAIAYQNDGDYRAIAGDINGALESFRKKLTLDEQYLHDDPLNAQARDDVAYSCARVGMLLAKLGDFTQALSYSQKALPMYEKLAADAPQNLGFRYRVIILSAVIGETQARLGRREEALAAASKAMVLLKETPENSTSSGQTDFRGQGYMYLGAAYAALAISEKGAVGEQRKYWRSARDVYRRSLDIWQDMKQRGILTAEDADKPEEVARAIAECDAALAANEE